MPPLIVLLSGRICTGKTTLAKALALQHEFKHFSTRDFLVSRGGTMVVKRQELQSFGEALDRKTKGSWLRDDLAIAMQNLGDGSRIVLDSVRIQNQINFLRESFGSKIVH